MTIIDTMAMCTDSSLTNAECKPLEELKIKSFIDGHWVDIPALDEHWVSHGRVFVQYFPPPLLNDLDEVYPLGAKEDWLERMSYFQSDLKWLLSLNHHRFWSQIVNGEDSLIGVESFLQEATPFYVMKSFPNDSKMIDEYKIAQHLVFLILIRLTTQKESEKEWIGSKKLGQLWYDKYLVTLPILFDMCLLFGHTNKAQLTTMVTRIFEIQPLYNEDVKNAIVFVDERLRMVQEKMKSKKSNSSYQPLKLIDHSKSQHSIMRSDFTLLSLTDILLYLLDTAVNLTSFLAVYQPARAIFHSLHFETRIVSVYENTIPSLCQELDLLAKKEDTIDVYFDLKYKLDLTRLELLKLFRYCSYSTLDSLLDSRSTLSEEEIKSSVDNFISVLSEFLSDRVFVQDYNNKYPVDCDLNMLSQVSPELDSVKCEFLIESVLSCYDLPASKPKASTSSSSMNKLANDYSGPSNIVNGNSVNVKKKVKGVELQSLITEVKDVLPHLGDGFVQKCLEYYDYKSESVVVAVLESTLPEPLECLDMDMPAIEDTEPVEENGLPERINVFDNDELDIMTQDQIDISKVHTGKWKHGKKCANELLNDKSHINHIRESYAKLGIVEDENVYDDEYDDTYDGLDVSVKEAEEPERRPFTTPRVLQNAAGHDNSPEEEESDKEEIDNNARYQEQFVENPEVVRARLEQRRQQRQQNRGFKHQSRDLVGKPKGQGQESNILHNREFKNSHKSSYANHNRRAGAQRKRNQGMMPS